MIGFACSRSDGAGVVDWSGVTGVMTIGTSAVVGGVLLATGSMIIGVVVAPFGVSLATVIVPVTIVEAGCATTIGVMMTGVVVVAEPLPCVTEYGVLVEVGLPPEVDGVNAPAVWTRK